jgi:hypothetical protein
MLIGLLVVGLGSGVNSGVPDWGASGRAHETRDSRIVAMLYTILAMKECGKS